MNSYKELIVWQKSMDLAKEVYFLSERFPRSEIFGLTSQIRRSAVSIPSNIAEGFGRKHRAEFLRFLGISFGSAVELETQIELAKSLKFSDSHSFAKAENLLLEVQKMLNKLRSSSEN